MKIFIAIVCTVLFIHCSNAQIEEEFDFASFERELDTAGWGKTPNGWQTFQTQNFRISLPSNWIYKKKKAIVKTGFKSLFTAQTNAESEFEYIFQIHVVAEEATNLEKSVSVFKKSISDDAYYSAGYETNFSPLNFLKGFFTYNDDFASFCYFLINKEELYWFSFFVRDKKYLNIIKRNLPFKRIMKSFNWL